MKRIVVGALALSLSLMPSLVSAGGPGDVSHPGDYVLVKFRRGTSESAKGRAIDRVDGHRVGRLDLIGVDVVAVDGSAAAAADSLDDEAKVVYAEPNVRKHAIASIPNDPYFGSQWGLNQSQDHDIDAPEGWAAAYGTDAGGATRFPTTVGGPLIGIIDTGIDTDNSEFAGKIVGCAKALSGNGAVTIGTCEDGDGHGTHVAGIAAARTNNGVGIAGVAPDARLVICKALDNNGNGWVADINGCMTWLAGKGVSVISESLGGGFASSEQNTVRNVWNNGAGTLIVAAAGNAGNTSVEYPAGYAEVVSVGSTTSSDTRSSFSNYNSDVEVSAPGSSILSTVPGGGYQSWSGTSMATPHASAVAAMIALTHPGMSAAQLRGALGGAVDDLGAAGRDTSFGFGRVNLAKAVGGGPPPPPPSEKGNVTGIVRKGKKAISGASVSWTGPQSGSTSTNANGRYTASGLPVGTYTFTAGAKGCTPKSAQVTVTAGTTTTRNFSLSC
jgi:thermitase